MIITGPAFKLRTCRRQDIFKLNKINLRQGRLAQWESVRFVKFFVINWQAQALIGNRPRRQERPQRQVRGQVAGHEINLELEDVLDKIK